NLVTTSRYVSRGLKYGLSNWRESDYQWERFGIQKPIRNADLWQRVDQALKFHGVTCRLIQANSASAESQPDEAGREARDEAGREYPLADGAESPASPQPQIRQRSRIQLRPPMHPEASVHQDGIQVAVAPPALSDRSG